MLTIYMKPTNYCNVGCDHCYLPESVRAEKLVMSDDILIKTALLAKELALKEKHDSIHFIWHGGEPLMLPPEFYYKATAILDEKIGNDYYTQSLQTSMIPFTDKWIPLIKEKFNSFIGTSIDFSQRTVKGSPDKYLDLFMKKVNLARENDIYIVPGMVPSKNEIERSEFIVDWVINNGFSEINIERYSKIGSMSNANWPSNREHSRFLIGFFDSIINRLENNLPVVKNNVMVSAIKGIMFSISGDRWGTQCQKSFVVVEPDGSLNTCPDRAKHEKPFSNILDGADAFRDSKDRRKWIRIMNVDHKKVHCFECKYRSWCKSGCPVTPNGIDDGEIECSGFRSFIVHVENYIKTSKENEARLLKYIEPLGEQITSNNNITDLKG